MDEQDRTRTHHALEFLGLRARATAIGLVQLCMELREAGLVSEEALARIKDAIAAELAADAPRTAVRQQYQADVRRRLDRIFAGQEPVQPSPTVSPADVGVDQEPSN